MRAFLYDSHGRVLSAYCLITTTKSGFNAAAPTGLSVLVKYAGVKNFYSEKAAGEISFSSELNYANLCAINT